MILRITIRGGEPTLLSQKLCGQAQAADSYYSIASIATHYIWSALCANCAIRPSIAILLPGYSGGACIMRCGIQLLQACLQQDAHTMCWHMRSHLVDGAGLPPSRGVLSALLSGEPAAALLAFIHSMVPWEALALRASPSVSSTARSAVSRMLAASVSPTVPFLTVVQTTGVSDRLCAGHHDHLYGCGLRIRHNRPPFGY